MTRQVSLVWRQINIEGDIIGGATSETEVDVDLYSNDEAILNFLKNEVSEYYNIPDEEISICEWSFTDEIPQVESSECKDVQSKDNLPNDEPFEKEKPEEPKTLPEDLSAQYVKIKLNDNYKYVRQGMEGLNFEDQTDAYHVGSILAALSNWNKKSRKSIASEIIRHACELLR